MKLSEYFAPQKLPVIKEGTKFLFSKGNKNGGDHITIGVLSQVELDKFTIICIEVGANRLNDPPIYVPSVKPRFTKTVMKKLISGGYYTFDDIRIITDQEAIEYLKAAWKVT